MKNKLGRLLLSARIGGVLWLPVLFLLATVVIALAAQFGDFGYTTNPDNTIIITNYTGSGGAVAIPDNIEGKTVTILGPFAFYSCTSLTNVTIPNSVTNIVGRNVFLGGGAFCGCTSLTNVTIGNSVIIIGDSTFYSCTSLADVTIPNSVTTIGGGAFASCTSLADVTIPNSVITIGGGAFGSCTSLTNVTIGTNVTSVNGFNGCTSLTSVTIPNSVTNIANGAFTSCTSLTNVTIGTNVTCINGFSRCTSLTSVTIPSSVATIAESAFYRSGLNSITIPASVIIIGDNAFAYCTSLAAITVDTNNAIYSSVDGVLFNKSQTTLIQCPGGKVGSYTVPDGVTNIVGVAYFVYGAFESCTSLTSVTIPASVTDIGSWAFYSCHSLTGVYFQGNAPSIGSDVFYGDDNATVYYLSGTTGWGETFGGRPTALWTAPVVITAQPQSLTNNPGSSASFTVAASGAAPLFYQWQKNAENIGSADNATFTIASVASGDAGNYRCIVSNLINAVTSVVATLTVNIAPPAPTGMTASEGTYTDKVAVSWSASIGADGYTIWRNTSDDSGVATSIGSVSGTAFDDTGTAPNATNYYWVKATNTVGSSGFSSSAAGWRGVSPVTYLDPPSNVSASDGTYTDKVAVTWNTVSGASGYQVWRAAANNSAAAINLGNAPLPSYDDSSSAVRPATMFYYWVKAFNSATTSEFSNVDSGFCRMSADPAIISGQPMVGDYDGDGKADPAVYNLASGQLFVWLTSAAYALVTPVTTFQVAAGDLPIVGDFDGDGLADPSVFERANGSWYLWLSGSGYFRVGPVVFGLNANDIPVPEDYDGDRTADPAVYQASSGEWHVWLSAAGYVKTGPFQFQKSLADNPVPGQFDAGFAADPAVYQQASGAWYIWLSSAGYIPLGPFTFSTTEDHIAVPADYDGDGLCDPAVYVPSLGKWRMWMSGNDYGLTEMDLR